MLKIDFVDFVPLAEYPELKIKMLSVSQSKRLEIMNKLKGNFRQVDSMNEDDKIKFILNQQEFFHETMKAAIVLVEGLQVGDKEIKTGEDFVTHAPKQVYDPVFEKSMELCGLSGENEKK